MKKTLLASLAVASTIGFFTPLTSHAFGLGKLELMSALNEPFKAEIDVTALRPEEKDNLQVKLASSDEFIKAGLDRSILLSQLQFDIVTRQGETKILITSKQAVKEPFLDFLLTASAGSGRLIREYTVLLDPPAYVLAETRSTTTTPAAKTQTAVEKASPSTTRYQYQASSFDGNSYAVKRNDTLWNVALKTRPSDSVSVHQMMMALLNANPSAFTNGNVNGLKAGVTLQVPAQSQINALSKAAAAAAFAEQTEAWKNRNKTSTPVTTVTEAKTPEQQDTAPSEATTADAEMQAADEQTGMTEADATDAAATTENDGRLQLVAPEDDVTSEDDAAPNVAGDDQIQKLTEQLTLAQETIEAQQQENVDFESRMDAMEEQLETMRRLISLKDADLARLQSTLEQKDPDLAAEVKAELETVESDAATETDAAAAPDSGDGQPDEMTTDTAQAAQQPQEAEVLNDADTDTLITDAAKALNLDAKEVQSTVDKVKQYVNENKLQTALGLLLILLILWLIARRSNREVTWDEAVKKMDKEKPEHDGPVVVAPVPEGDDNDTDAPLAGESEEKTVGELVEQADMFVGYADYVQAKNALEQARLQEPDNTLVAYKMLFVLYKQQQADDFVALTEATDFDKDSFEWDEIKQWGNELAPNHELFASKPLEQTADAADIEAVEQPETKASVQEDTLASQDLDEKETSAQDEAHIEFDLNSFSATPEEHDETDTESEPTKANADIDDDLLSFDSSTVSTKTADDDMLDLDVAHDTSDDDLSFDIDVPSEVDEFSTDEFETASDSDNDAPDLEFDVGDLDDIDEAETKLDLAAAYIDMDDPEGARSILNEVLLEGNDEQKNRAHSLLDSLS